MNNIRESYFIELDEDAQRQYIDARAVFTAWEDARRAADEVRGGMYWQTKHAQDYLIRTSASNSQKSLGPRSPDNEEIYRRFMERKQLSDKRVADLKKELAKHQRLNKVHRVGRAPNILVEILNKLYKSGIAEYFTVVGTHALYAYEAEAGLRILGTAALATRDVDLLWDIQRRLSFVTKMHNLDTSFLSLLKKVDPTFTRRDDQHHTAYNSKGFEVDLIRRLHKDGDPHPVQITDDEGDFYVVEAESAASLQGAAQFQTIIVSTSGQMARMKTVPPVVFAKTKRWLSELESREAVKRQRDKMQAEIVEKLLADHLLP
ncbi:hypothetical protein F6V25_14825 [Oryzomonas japonica]|uniref:Nucleotidyltransferase-like domain-containing protein n=1 Tax=Oryzomonas japonica TaxID=2603858 RepID=A0A7J4ZMW4_9BACT|nr:GSU2403 family nucleotidyltransferase fold protein [Oryzomonas japonica]KAB0664076.1 hypothetical protein F6V25_14825 [Oryzomonas japonica]